jgi:hypothetical protein
MFQPGDVSGAATALRSLLVESRRARLSADGRRLATMRFTLARHVELLVIEYNEVVGRHLGVVSERAECGLISR